MLIHSLGNNRAASAVCCLAYMDVPIYSSIYYVASLTALHLDAADSCQKHLGANDCQCLRLVRVWFADCIGQS